MTNAAKLRELEQRVATLKRTKLPGGSETTKLLSELLEELRGSAQGHIAERASKKSGPEPWEPDTLNEGGSK